MKNLESLKDELAAKETEVNELKGKLAAMPVYDMDELKLKEKISQMKE